MPDENWQEILNVLADRSRFPHIPKDLSLHLELCLNQGRNNPMMQALACDCERLAAAINRSFKMAASYTHLTADELLRQTDFNYHDTDATRIFTAFAEIRAINFLGAECFTNINLLRSGKVPRADIVADRNSSRYAIEVVNSVYRDGGPYVRKQVGIRTLGVSGRYTPEQLSDWIVKRLKDEKKEIQLRNTAKQAGASRLLFIGIIDSEEPVIFQTHAGFASGCKLAWEAIGAEENFHIALVTGRSALGYGSDNAVYPEWP
jgi:hypothetical protein